MRRTGEERETYIEGTQKWKEELEAWMREQNFFVRRGFVFEFHLLPVVLAKVTRYVAATTSNFVELCQKLCPSRVWARGSHSTNPNPHSKLNCPSKGRSRGQIVPFKIRKKSQKEAHKRRYNSVQKSQAEIQTWKKFIARLKATFPSHSTGTRLMLSHVSKTFAQ